MNRVILHEVGMRDGLQMEKQVVPIETKISWIDQLIDSGADIIQIGSFVNPSKVPQMADTDELFKKYSQVSNSKTMFSGLVLNERGMERGMEAGVNMFCMGVSASETHSMKNTGMTSGEACTRIINMAKQVQAAGKVAQVSVQSAFGCGFEGKIDETRVLEIVDKFLDAGLSKISLADTAGHAYPDQVKRLFGEIKRRKPDAELACHFHNTYGLGMANVFAAMESGVEYFESAFGALGGCPFTKTAAGNVATEDMVSYWQRNNIRMDLNLDKLVELAKDVATYFDRVLPGYVYKTGAIKY